MRTHAQTLDRSFADLEAALMGEGPIGHTLGVLKKISLECGIPMAIVGGIASNFYGLKLLAGRPEDLGDVYRLLRQKKPSERQEIQEKLDPRAGRRYRKVLEDLKRRFS